MFILHLAYIVLLRWIDPPLTLAQLGNIAHGIRQESVNRNKMGYNIQLAVLAGEDQLFTRHNGFDVKHIRKAIEHNKKHPNRRRGASTISQQTAKNVFLWQGGGWFRKGLETYFTFMIELLWPKERILEVYLNVAETGKGIYGVQAAAKTYFSKNASELTREEAARIAACLPNPKKYTVQPASRYVLRRSKVLLQQMRTLETHADIKQLLKN